MKNIVIAFPKKEIALGIKKVLGQSGYPVTNVCATGAQALAALNGLDDGVLVCGYRFVDMMYEELYEYLPEGFQMLVIASADVAVAADKERLMALCMPLKVHELLQTLEMMDYEMRRRKKRIRSKPRERSTEERQTLKKAKEILMERNKMTEEEAHRYIQKRSMDNGTALIETAQMIVSLMENR